MGTGGFLEGVLRDIVFMHCVGMCPVLVHGGKQAITEELGKAGIESQFVQGMRVRDIAQRLAMSEADLYRKQRLAIEEVARTLSEMEGQRQ